jgi:16S rRNA (guanine527-N7)-methyltransferase
MSRSSASSFTRANASIFPSPEVGLVLTALKRWPQAGALDLCVLDALARYGSLILEANRRVNLTAARTPEAIAAQIADSLTVLPYVAPPYVDIGSGGGFPAIPVAIAAGIPVTLVEPTIKKARLLESFLESQGIAGGVVPERAEIAAHRTELREHFFTGTCRAVASAPAVAELLLPLIAPGGAAVLQRGSMERRERTALEDASLVLGAALESEERLEGERRIIVLRKLTATPQRFPRRTGVPQKRPLCE